MDIDTWTGCYPSNWKGIIVPEAFQHPAKFSRKLIARIYQHAFEEGWLKPGDRVLDCFGGVALGALDAMRYGLDWTGIELEPRFQGIGQANIDLWNAQHAGRLNRWGTARLVQGDSRQLVQVIQTADGLVSSPPYVDRSIAPTNIQGSEAGSLRMNEGQTYTGVISSPPYAETLSKGEGPGARWAFKTHSPENAVKQTSMNDYGATPGQLGALPAGNFETVISSPPYADSVNQGDGANNSERRRERMAEAGVNTEQSIKRGGPNSVYNQPQAYGATPGQLGAMTGKDYQSVISSPPFENTLSRDVVDAEARRRWAREHGISNAEHVSPVDMERIGCRDQSYGSSEGQIGNSQGETFWSAALQIVEQTYQVLTPGAHAIWVVKAYVKDHQYVDFPGQWRALCEACGFTAIRLNV